MAGFESKATTKIDLPADVPDAAESALSHPDGAVYASDTGKRFRLRHARWVPVVARKPRKAAATK